jgi:cell division protein FtsW (lipid II flippase)
MSARTKELFGLIPVTLLVTAGFTAVLLTRTKDVHDVTAIYGAVFLGCCLFAHIFIRARLPDADPYLFPLVALLAAFGLVMIYRIDADLAREQAQWFIFGLLLFCVTIVFLRDIHMLERYRYTIAFIGIALLLAPRLPGIGQQVNGAYLAVKLGPVQFQPAEFGKIAIIIFLASYLRDTRDVLVRGRLPRISLKHMGPLLVVWGGAMLMLVVIQDLGSSLMFFAGFLALLYVATNRLSLVAAGLALFVAGSVFFAANVSHIHSRVQTWQDPFSTRKVICPSTGHASRFVDCQGFQIAQALFAEADGGLFGKGFGQALLSQPNGPPILPAAHTDLIYAVITDELGLFGAAAVILIYMLFTARGFKTAMLATDDFSKLLATGLTAVLAIQVFVIIGGVVKVIPLTGVTLPFISYGGSSLVANFVILALLLIVSDTARRDRAALRGGVV